MELSNVPWNTKIFYENQGIRVSTGLMDSEVQVHFETLVHFIHYGKKKRKTSFQHTSVILFQQKIGHYGNNSIC